MAKKMTDNAKLAAALKNLAKLPDFAFNKLESTGETIMILRGQEGYMEVAEGTYPVSDPDILNLQHGVTKIQAEAMLNGSSFGWHVPGADVDFLTEAYAKKKPQTP